MVRALTEKPIRCLNEGLTPNLIDGRSAIDVSLLLDCNSIRQTTSTPARRWVRTRFDAAY
jgi:hypothetical protein